MIIMTLEGIGISFGDTVLLQNVTQGIEDYDRIGVIGINGTGKTTTVGKLAKRAADAGRKVLIGNADTFRAAATEQLGVWGERAGVEVVERGRGADPASVCYDVIERAEELEGVTVYHAGTALAADGTMDEIGKKYEDIYENLSMI